jgi:hypothetical protein
VLAQHSVEYAEGWRGLPLSTMRAYRSMMATRDTIRIVQNIAHNSMFSGEVRIERVHGPKEDDQTISDRSKLVKPFMRETIENIDAWGFSPGRWIQNTDPLTCDADPFKPVVLNIDLVSSALVRVDINSQLEWKFFSLGKSGEVDKEEIKGVFVIVANTPTWGGGQNAELLLVSRMQALYNVFAFSDNKVACETEADRRRAFDAPVTIDADSGQGGGSHKYNPNLPINGTAEFPGNDHCVGKKAHTSTAAMMYSMALSNNNGLAHAVKQADEERRNSERNGPPTRDLEPGRILAPNYKPPEAPEDTFVALENALGTTAQMWGIPRNAISNGNATGKATMQDGESETSMMNQVYTDSQAITRRFLEEEMEKAFFNGYFQKRLADESTDYHSRVNAQQRRIQAKRKKQHRLSQPLPSAVVPGRKRKVVEASQSKHAADSDEEEPVVEKAHAQIVKENRFKCTMPVKTPFETVAALYEKGWLRPDRARPLMAAAIPCPIEYISEKAPPTEVEFKEKEMALNEKTQADAHKVAMRKPPAGSSSKK